MFVPKPETTSIIKLYRRSFLLRSLFWIMFLCDLVLALFSPLVVFFIVLAIHVGVFFMYLNARCLFMGAMVEELTPRDKGHAASSDC